MSHVEVWRLGGLRSHLDRDAQASTGLIELLHIVLASMGLFLCSDIFSNRKCCILLDNNSAAVLDDDVCVSGRR